MRLAQEVRYRGLVFKAINAGGPPSGEGPGSGNYEHKKSALSDQELTDKFRGELKNDWEGSKAKYRAQFGNVLNPDNAMQLSGDFQNDRTRQSGVVNPARELVQAIYKDMLAEPVPPGKNNTVVFTAGPPGSGKTSGIAANPALNSLANHAHIVQDSTLTDPVASIPRIKAALDAGKDVHVVYVYRDPIDAWRNGVLPRAEDPKDGRVVPLNEAAMKHAAARASVTQIQKEFANNPHFSFTAIDNSRGFGNAKETGLKDLPPAPASKEDLAVKMRQALDEEYLKGKVSAKNYRGALELRNES